MCTLNDLLFVPELAYNLTSMSKASQSGKILIFYDHQCKISGSSNQFVSFTQKSGILYYVKQIMLRNKNVK